MRITIVLLALLLQGCAIPWPVTVGSYVLDAGLVLKTGKTSTEHAASIITQEDCNYGYILNHQTFCLSQDEYIDVLIKMDCEVYKWDMKNQPYCRSKKTGSRT